MVTWALCLIRTGIKWGFLLYYLGNFSNGIFEEVKEVTNSRGVGLKISLKALNQQLFYGKNN